ncbi:tyrosine-type recombinase/integrase [Brochothrix thermosphacta]|uniref:Site-specific integrase n=1 Tax=Brochothrix thermosphacta TaxID=2756 RepID=A0A1D2K053_BROTH|nr:tyrosine-type recombinase/integrase [Brochothrix thermosphacta]ATF26400.1 site-specific integrase [Brochothrix thermosphacta]ATH85740.1 site-specific integrase [Brochothrix thermosphacta]MPQ28787.1 site-specific integrase [Brochothrix thermosphacta]ODJ51089.1 integrase [Brochothrix thermosphacta]ODJ54101.1 integrase [Brochothrix thermosphacta]
MATFKQYETKKGKRWLFKHYIGTNEETGKRESVLRRGFTTKKEANLALSRLLLEIEQGGLKKNRQYKYHEVATMWLEQYKNTVKESTYAKTLFYFKKHILPIFGDIFLHKISSTTCQKAINKWHKQKYSMYKSWYRYTSKVFEYAVTLNIIDINPTVRVTIPKKIAEVNEQDHINFYNKEELQHFFKCLETENNYSQFTFFRLLAFSGIRKGEALALKWQDINFTTNTLNINKTLSRGINERRIIQTPKTKTSIRTLSLDPQTVNILKTWREKQKEFYFMQGINTLTPKQLLFSNKHNELLDARCAVYSINKVITKYNLKRITTHGLRHTHCSLLFESGASLQDVKERLGHSDIQTTMNIYTHVTEKAKENTADRFAKYVNF